MKVLKPFGDILVTKIDHQRPILKLIDEIKRQRAATRSTATKPKTVAAKKRRVSITAENILIHHTACSVLTHIGKHKDVRMAERLIEGVPIAQRKRLRCWFSEFGPIDFVGVKAKYRRGGTTALGQAMQSLSGCSQSRLGQQRLDLAVAYGLRRGGPPSSTPTKLSSSRIRISTPTHSERILATRVEGLLQRHIIDEVVQQPEDQADDDDVDHKVDQGGDHCLPPQASPHAGAGLGYADEFAIGQIDHAVSLVGQQLLLRLANLACCADADDVRWVDQHLATVERLKGDQLQDNCCERDHLTSRSGPRLACRLGQCRLR